VIHLHKVMFSVDIRKKIIFTIMMVKNRNQLPKTVVESPLLEMLRASLVKALGNLIRSTLICFQ